MSKNNNGNTPKKPHSDKSRPDKSRHHKSRQPKKISPETMARFKALYNREPDATDNFVFEHYLYQGKDHWHLLRDTAQRANIDPKPIFMFEKTGFKVGDFKDAPLSKVNQIIWDKASNDYDDLLNENIDPFLTLDYDSFEEYFIFQSLTAAIDDAIIHLGSFIDKNHQLEALEPSKFTFLYYAARVFNNLKTLRFLIIQKALSRDAFGLVRTLYECMLRVRFVKNNDEAVETFIAQSQISEQDGLENPAFSYKIDSKGHQRKGWIIDHATGKELRAKLQLKEMAESSGDPADSIIHDEIYRYLSGVTHVGLNDVPLYFSTEHGFFKQGHKENNTEVLLLALAITSLFMLELSSEDIFTDISRQDASFISYSLAKKIIEIPIRYPEAKILPKMPKLLKRLQNIGAA